MNGQLIGGGKFANGATTAAYGYLFNQMMHDPKTGVGYKTSCANTDCLLCGANVDQNDPSTRSYQKQSLSNALGNAGDAATLVGLLFPPAEVPASMISWAATTGQSVTDQSVAPLAVGGAAQATTMGLTKIGVPASIANWSGAVVGKVADTLNGWYGK